MNGIDNENILREYRKQVRAKFTVVFGRPPSNDNEVMAYAIANFLVDHNSPGREAFSMLIAYAASVMRMWIPKDEDLSTIDVTERLIETFAQIIQIGIKEKLAYETEQKRRAEKLQGIKDTEALQALANKLQDLLLPKN